MDTTAKLDSFGKQDRRATAPVARAPAVRTVARVTCTAIRAAQPPFDVACHIWGTRQRPVALCVHGMTRNARDFDPLAQRLAAENRVVCIDLPGRGDSDRLEDPADYSDATYLSVVRQVMDRLELGRVAWIGASLGGVLGMKLAEAEPARIAALVLNDTGAELHGPELQRLCGIASADVSFQSPEEAEAYLRQFHSGLGPLSADRWRQLAATSFERVDGGLIKRRLDVRAIPDGRIETRINLWPTYRALTCPTLVIRGADSALLLRDTCTAMMRCGPRARTVEVLGGHAPDLSTPFLLSEISSFVGNAFG